MNWVVGTKTEYGTMNANMIYDETGGAICSVYGLPMHTDLEKMPPRYAKGLQVARLIAAAPRLAEALELIAQQCEAMQVGEIGSIRPVDVARQALALLKG